MTLRCLLNPWRFTGKVRITTVEHAAKTILVPAMKRILAENPGVSVEITVDNGLVDIVADRYDGGVKLGGEIAKDMIAMRIGPDIPMTIVGSPTYFKRQSIPTVPSQLTGHQAINLLLPTSRKFHAWRLWDEGTVKKVQVNGQLVLNTFDMMIDATLDGNGIAYLPLDQVDTFIHEGKLIRILQEFTPDWPGYHLYYPHRSSESSAFKLVVESLRHPTTAR